MAGALALGNAKCLVGLVLTQLVRRSTAFLYGMNTAALDMKSAIVSYGAPEWPIGMAARTDIGRYYNLPVWGAAGATDSKVVDAQAECPRRGIVKHEKQIYVAECSGVDVCVLFSK